MKKIICLIPIILSIGIYCLDPSSKPKVYFTKSITPESLVTLYDKLGIKLSGNIALKVHSGEPEGPYFLRPSFLKKIYDHVGGTFVEANTAYNSGRWNTSIHMETAKSNGWINDEIKFQIMDEDPEKDITIEIPKYKKISKNIVGEHLSEYNSCLVLSHLKGHGMGGFGGAMKQLSIGFASRAGKAYIHSAGENSDASKFNQIRATQENFTASMADAASSIVNFFKGQNYGGIAYINVMVNISRSCDCEGKRAKAPEIEDIGVLASTDPIAIDQASIDLIKKSKDCEGKTKWLEQLAKRLGENTLTIGQELGMGTKDYEFVDIDEKKDDKGDKGSESHFMKLGLYSILLILCLFI